MADDKSGGITFSKLNYGTINSFGDSSAINSGSRRRGEAKAYIDKLLKDAYARNALEGHDKFYGIIINSRVMSDAIYAKRGPMLTAVGKSPGAELKVPLYYVYKVYVPELDPRPFPLALNDPIIYTYQDYYTDPNLEESMGTNPFIPVGALVTVQYANLYGMSDPMIISFESLIQLKWKGLEGTIVAQLWPTAHPTTVAGSRGVASAADDAEAQGTPGATDRGTSKCADNEKWHAAGDQKGKKWGRPTKDLPSNWAEIPGPPGHPNYRSGKIDTWEQIEGLVKKYKIKRIVNLAADSLWRQKDTRSIGGGPCGLAEKDQCDGGDCDSSNFGCVNACERIWAGTLGVEWIFAPIGGRGSTAKRFWPVVEEALLKGDTLIHCVAGTDRTGSFAGRWKRTVQQEFEDDDMLLEYVRSTGSRKKGQEWDNYNTKKNGKGLKTWMLEGKYDAAKAAKIKGS